MFHNNTASLSYSDSERRTNNTNIFKKRLDKYWQHQDIIYDFRAEIEGTGSRSEVSRVNVVNL